jgi:hypothetical protein
VPTRYFVPGLCSIKHFFIVPWTAAYWVKMGLKDRSLSQQPLSSFHYPGLFGQPL